MFERAIANAIQIEVESRFVPEQSAPSSGRYFFSYRVRIRNEGPLAVQLMTRHWIIVDGYGRLEEVKGVGVIGQQPRIKAGETFEYESFCPLPTPTGSMRGSFLMTSEDGSRFRAEIPQFFLIEPGSYH